MVRGATRRLAVILSVLVGIALILPAPGDAFGAPTSVAWAIGCPPLEWAQQTAPLPTGATVPQNPGVERLVREITPPIPSLAPIKSSPSIIAEHDLPITITGADGVTLTPEEYDQFRQMLGTKRATAWEVALLNLSVKGTGIVMVGTAWIILLVIMRYVFNRWWDEDLYKNVWASAVVVVAKIICAAWILKSVIQ